MRVNRVISYRPVSGVLLVIEDSSEGRCGRWIYSLLRAIFRPVLLNRYTPLCAPIKARNRRSPFLCVLCPPRGSCGFLDPSVRPWSRSWGQNRPGTAGGQCRGGDLWGGATRTCRGRAVSGSHAQGPFRGERRGLPDLQGWISQHRLQHGVGGVGAESDGGPSSHFTM